MNLTRSAWLGALLLTAVGCSKSDAGVDDGLTATTTAVTPATKAAASTTAATTTTAAIVTTTAVPTAAVQTTIAEPTTTVDVSAQVAAGYQVSIEAYFTCLRAPAECDPATVTASTGPGRANLTKTVSDMVAGGLYDGQEDWGYAVVELVTLDSPTVARLQVCAWDTAVLYGPPPEEGGEPTIVKNRPDTVRLAYVMHLEDTWKIAEETLVSKTPEVNECPAES